MALTTQSMAGEVKKEVAGAPEGYEFVHDEKGRMAIRKIRKKVEAAKNEDKPEIKKKKILRRKK